MSKGTELIAAERARQVSQEGYDAEHDKGHARELMLAAGCYVMEAQGSAMGFPTTPAQAPIADEDLGISNWPWHPSYWKPTGDPVRDLVKAGALIAAAIDSLVEVR
jgi:hypothetical protein